MFDHDAACDYQYCGEWNDPFTEKSGGKMCIRDRAPVCKGAGAD